MSAMLEAPAEPIADFALDSLRTALALRCGLTEAELDHIDRAQAEGGLSFGEAALGLGYITQEDLDQARTALERVAAPRAPVRAPDFYPARQSELNREKLRVLRTELLLRHDSSRKRANVVAVISPCAAEGRSQLAADLARSFATLGQPTLLVDADLRRPSLHLLFGTDNDTGLTDAISSSFPPQPQPVDETGLLHLLTAGPATDSPVELLCSRSFEALLGVWARQYEHIVFDTPPTTDYPDALALATIAGRVLMVSRARHTPMRATREMLRRLESTRAELLGAVIGHF